MMRRQLALWLILFTALNGEPVYIGSESVIAVTPGKSWCADPASTRIWIGEAGGFCVREPIAEVVSKIKQDSEEESEK